MELTTKIILQLQELINNLTTQKKKLLDTQKEIIITERRITLLQELINIETKECI